MVVRTLPIFNAILIQWHYYWHSNPIGIANNLERALNHKVVKAVDPVTVAVIYICFSFIFYLV
jgi:hypothetical protein